MRCLRTALGASALLALLAACSQAGPIAPLTANVRAVRPLAAKSVPGRLVIHWADRARAASVSERLGLHTQAHLAALDTDVVTMPAGLSAERLQEVAAGAIDSAEPDYMAHTYVVPNDPHLGDQYALRKVHAAEAWDVTQGSRQVKIAIIDTGVDLAHPDLQGQIAASYNAMGPRATLGAHDDNGHGTHCAGIAAATANNAEGIAGIAPGCQLLVVKALGEDGSGAISDIARGVGWAVDNGAAVISLSMGCDQDGRTLRVAIARAIAAGVTVVAAMGNDGTTVRNFPAAYPGVVAVGATDGHDHAASYSTRGSWISVAAPGSAILSTTPTYPVFMSRSDQEALAPGYGTLSGTSMATPLVAGLAALLKSQHPDWRPAQIKAAIEQSADSLPIASERIGRGRINAASALH